jgi:hypothetical protein
MCDQVCLEGEGRQNIFGSSLLAPLRETLGKAKSQQKPDKSTEYCSETNIV